jgi:integrase
MPRKVKDRALDTREARNKLKARGKPYWRSLSKGMHIGYRRISGQAGTWSTRKYLEDGAYKVELLGTADDHLPADGVTILDFWQAQDKAQQRFRRGPTSPCTVGDILTTYLNELRIEGRPPDALEDTRARVDNLIRPALGAIKLAELTNDDVKKWLNKLAMSKSKKRADDDPDQLRARRASSNRVLALLKAALNRAYAAKKIDDDRAWSTVEAFTDVHKARDRFLTVEQAIRLVNAADEEFRPLLRAALYTGARYGSLTSLRVADFNADANTIKMATRKGDGSQRTYHVALNEEGAAFFRSMTVGRAGNALIFARAKGSPWKKSAQHVFMIRASEGARIDPPINFHAVRHSYASLAIMAGTPLMMVAQNLGHTNTKMVEKHYGHLSPSYRAQMIEKMPSFGFEDDRKVTTLHPAVRTP